MIFLNEAEVVQNRFPDGTLNIKMCGSSRNTIHWYYENDAELFTLMCIVDKIREDYPKADIVLMMPYVPHARMDRVKDVNDVFTLKTFCNTINAMDFNLVCVKDVHSNVAAGLLNRCHEDKVHVEIDFLLDKLDNEVGNLALFFPDEGARKRYEYIIDRDEVAFGIKKRDWKSGKILGLDIHNAENVKGKNVLIIDDICSRGGTFYHSAKALKEAGAEKIYLYITHCEKTIFEGELQESGLIEHVYTTPTIFNCEDETEWLTTI